MKKEDLKLSQEVFCEPMRNALRYGKEIKKATVTSMGNKYFGITFENHISEHRLKFSYDTMQEKSEYSSDWQVYLSMKEIVDKTLKPQLIDKIKIVLNKMTVEQLSQYLDDMIGDTQP